MKKRIILITAFLWISLFSWSQGETGIVGQYLRNRGGVEALNAVNSVRLTGKFVHGKSMEMNYAIIAARPDKIRVEYTVYDQKIIAAHAGGKGWQTTDETDAIPTELSGAALEGLKDNLELVEDPLLNFREKGFTLKLVGEDKSGVSPCYVLERTLGNDRKIFYHIGGSNYILEKVIRVGKKENGAETRTEVRLSDYRTVSGVRFAFRREVFVDGREAGVMIFEVIEININPADTLFEMPAAAKKE